MATENGKLHSDAPAVVVLSTSTVKPSRPAPVPRCPLSTFDLPYITFYYNQKLILYATREGDAFEKLVGGMTESLAEALAVFYPLAGRLRQDEEGVMEIDCTGHGAEVAVAAAEEVDVGSLTGRDGDAGVLRCLVPYNNVMNLDGLHRPLLAVQFTKLKNGLAVGCAFNHAILDGASTWHFLLSWSEISRAGASVSVPPFHDRAALRATRVPVSLPASAAAHELADPNRPAATADLRAKILSFPASLLTRLKTDASAAGHPASTFQSLVAHVWRAVCKARGLPADAPTVFAIFIDCRRRIDPPAPEAYFGNVVQAIFTATAAGVVLDGPPGIGAGLLREVIAAHDAGAVAGRLKGYEAAPKMFHYSDAGPNCLAVGSSPRFRVYDVDFGFGRPERVRSGCNNKFDGVMYLYPERDGGQGIDVELTLESAAMEKLEEDDEFLIV